MFDRAKSKYLQAFESLHKLGDVAMSMSERGEKYEVKNAHWVCKPSFYKSVCMYVCMRYAKIRANYSVLHVYC